MTTALPPARPAVLATVPETVPTLPHGPMTPDEVLRDGLPASWWDLADAGLLPAAPLVAAVTLRGGIAPLTAPYPQTVAYRLSRAFYRARAAGTVRPLTADELAIRLLDRHPSRVWGPLWHAVV